MSGPAVKIICLNNVFTKLMHFHEENDSMKANKFLFDHGALVSSGKVRVNMYDEAGNITNTKDFTAPDFAFIQKGVAHELVALENNTVCAFIHALRTIDQELLEPDFLVNPLYSGSGIPIRDLVQQETGQGLMPFIAP